MALQHLTDSNFEEAIKGAPVSMVDFFATWCGPCKMMSPIVEKLAEEYDEKALVGKVDTDNETDTAQKYGIFSIPTLIFFKNGQEIERKVGVTPEAEIREILDSNL